MRRRALLVPAVASVAMIGTPAIAQAAQTGQATTPYPALHAAIAATQAFENRMIARGHPQRALAGTSLAGTAVASAAGGLTNVRQISKDTLPSAPQIEPNTQVEPDVAIDQANPRIMTAASQEGRDGVSGGCQDGGFATSHDGGRTWTFGNLPYLTTATGGQFQLTSDTAVAFGPDGSDYVQTIPFDLTTTRSAVAVQRSGDGGLTFGKPSLVVDDHSKNIFNDKNWIAADTNRNSPFHGRLYSVWSRFITTGTGTTQVTHSPATVSYSDNDGRTWSPLHFASSATTDSEGLIPLIHADGAITIVYDQTIGSADYEVAQTSHDGGAIWSSPVKIGQFLGAGVPGMRTGGLPSAAIDPSTGDEYVVWQDTRFNSAGLNDVVMSESTNGGATWSAPRMVSPVVTGADRFTPAVAASGGNVYIGYRTRGGSGTAPDVSENYVVSTDGGKTFSSQQAAGPPTVLKYAAVSIEGGTPVAFLGDYMGLAATPHSAQLLWDVASTPPVASQKYDQDNWSGTITP